ncbi:MULTISPECIES: LmeA family phospholipid-binding protein [unclassified Nocardia]|uniref:LmeA family phospholipid-binding protein n=1 Tax=unclassified Nocardia TaxID=2637762 RepID=UPI001CE3C72B|nr:MULTISPECIES: LmeA family phospholipid-binding protein [unclassified Nocardia]
MRKLIIGLLCLAGLAVVIDFGAAAFSEYTVSRALRHGADLTADPEVTIHGFPFVLKALDGKLNGVDIKAFSKRPDIPGEISVEATLTGVHLPAASLVDGNLRNVLVDRVEGRMVLRPEALGRFFNIPDLEVHLDPDDKSDKSLRSGGADGSNASKNTSDTQSLVLTGTLPVLPGARYGGQKVSVKANLMLDSEHNQMRFIATGLYRGSGVDAMPTAVIPDADQPAVLEQFTRTIDTKELPFGVRPAKAFPRGGWIVVEGSGQNMTIDLDRLQRP